MKYFSTQSDRYLPRYRLRILGIIIIFLLTVVHCSLFANGFWVCVLIQSASWGNWHVLMDLCI